MGIDDRSRVGIGKKFANERKRSAMAFLDYALAYCRVLGVRIRRIMTENAKILHSKLWQSRCSDAMGAYDAGTCTGAIDVGPAIKRWLECGGCAGPRRSVK